MLHLTPFSLVWDGDWRQFTHMMEAYLAEVCTPQEAAQEIAELHDPALSAELIRQAARSHDPYCVMRITQEKTCIGLITFHYQEAARSGHINNLYIAPAHRGQGLGAEAIRLAEQHLRRLGAKTVSLHPMKQAAGLYRHCGYAPDPAEPALWRKTLPVFKGAAPIQLLYYTREALDDSIYAPKLADSLHLALIEDSACTPLLHNSGIVYAKAVSGDLGVLHPYSLRKPWMTSLPDGQWAVVAERIECDGSPDPASEDHVLFFTTHDLIHYTEQPLLHISDPLAQAYYEHRSLLPDLADLDLPFGCIPAGVIPIDAAVARRLRTRFLTPVNVANEFPEEVTAAAPEALHDLRAVARYSDGSTVRKRVDWDLTAVDWSKRGRYAIEGRIHQDRFEFPTMWHKADPAVCRWQGKYYFISTNDLDDNRTLYIRAADSLPGLATAQQVCILDNETYPHLGNLLWAPEMHVIGGRLYIFHAGTPGPFGQEQCHVMALRDVHANPLKADSWEMPRRVVRADGSMLYDKGITLDMTVFWSAQRLYAVWSQRQFDPVDLGAWLYIAELDPEKPWQLLTEPQVLTVPEYGWENNHTFVVEGPFALYRSGSLPGSGCLPGSGRIILTYSGALVDSTYAVGMMSMADGADPLDPSSWTKENYPLLTSRSVEGEFGPGHNAYVTDEDGLVWNTYHARPGIREHGGKQGFGPRSSGIRRVHFNAEDFPVLDMTEEKDLDPRLAWVRTTLIIP